MLKEKHRHMRRYAHLCEHAHMLAHTHTHWQWHTLFVQAFGSNWVSLCNINYNYVLIYMWCNHVYLCIALSIVFELALRGVNFSENYKVYANNHWHLQYCVVLRLAGTFTPSLSNILSRQLASVTVPSRVAFTQHKVDNSQRCVCMHVHGTGVLTSYCTLLTIIVCI